ncbi:hypothetical protein [Limnofasciculus baicalensis]|uniref:hypothetical protein n=1 Tax=Limnofasciculus baicalensis TaxID=3064906 RepID=UPI00359F8014
MEKVPGGVLLLSYPGDRDWNLVDEPPEISDGEFPAPQTDDTTPGAKRSQLNKNDYHFYCIMV